MSYQDGWAALNLEMPARVPHTEYSIESHWEVVEHFTGLKVTPESPDEIKSAASLALIKAINLDFRWNILVNAQLFGELHTDMGHAVYQAGGTDWRDPKASPFSTPEQVLNFDFFSAYGSVNRSEWTARFEDHYRSAVAEAPDMVNMTGIYTTLVSGLIEIFGWENLLLAAGTDPAAFGKLTSRYADWVLQLFEALAEADVPVVMVHDDMVWTSGPIFSPRFYRQFLFPNLKRLLHPLRESGKKIMFTSDGNFSAFIDDIADCGVHGFVMEPMTDMAAIAQKYGKTHVFIGNADTRVLLSGSREDIRVEVERCMAIGKPYPGFFMAVGNHIPSNTPLESVLYYLRVYEELSRR